MKTMAMKRIIFLLAFVALVSTPVIAARKAGNVNIKPPTDVDSNIPIGAEKAGRYDIAVVIGNKSYLPHADDVDYAIRDAEVMKEYLVTLMGFDPKNVFLHKDANRLVMEEEFGTRNEPGGHISELVVKGQSRVFVYYAGHGAPDGEGNNLESYFVPVGADLKRLKITGYRQQTLYDNLAKLGAKSVTVVLDTCFSGMLPNKGGSLIKGVSAVSRTPPKIAAAPDSILRITSSKNDQVSTWYPEMKHGLFTYYYLKGLRGEADANSDGRITAAEMRGWLDKYVPFEARRLSSKQQTPEVEGDDSAVLVVLKR